MEEESELVELTPLCGAGPSDPLCSLLKIGGLHILLDCGWNDKFDVNALEPLKKVCSKIDLVLISFPDLEHMGALPYAIKHFGLCSGGESGKQVRICLTKAAADLGVLCLYDVYISKSTSGEFPYFDLDDIDILRDNFLEVNFEQPVKIGGANLEVSILRAGRLLGGGMWRIKREPDDILYAVDFNHRREAHLDGANDSLSSSGLKKPTAMITDGFNITTGLQPRQREREKPHDKFLRKVIGKLRSNGNVLLPTDCSGRVLELLLLLEKFWEKNKFSYPILWANHVVHSASRHVQAHLEFTSKALNESFIRDKSNPFRFKHVNLVSSVEEIGTWRSPKVILCSGPDLEYGFSKDLLLQFAQNRSSLLLFTDRTMGDSLTRRLCSSILKKEVVQPATLKYSKWEYAQGEELEAWQAKEADRDAEKQRQQKEMEATKKRRLQQMEAAKALQDDMAGGDSETVAVDSGIMPNGAKDPSSPLHRMKRQRSVEHGGGLFAIFAAKLGHTKMFSAPEPYRLIQRDDYGEVIDEKDYMIESKERASYEQEALTKDTDDQLNSENLLKRGFGNVAVDCSLPKHLRDRLPRKVVESETTIRLQCELEYIDIEGRSTWNDSRNLISNLDPSKVVLLRRSKGQVEEFKQRLCTDNKRRCLTPDINQPVSIASDTGVWKIKLSRSLFDKSQNPMYEESLNDMVKVANKEVAYIEGVVRKTQIGGRNYSVLEPIPLAAGHTDQRVVPSIEQCLVRSGELTLSYLQNKLLEKKIKAKFANQVLVCSGGKVTIRVGADKKIQLTGALCSEYFEIRNLIYSRYISV